MRCLIDTRAAWHWKLRHLGKRLRNPLGGYYAIKLWSWAFDQAKDGDLTRFTPKDIALAVDWPGRPTRLIKALVEVRLLDEAPLRIHDWDEHNGSQRRSYDAEVARKREFRERKREEAERNRRETERLAAEEAARRAQESSGVTNGVPPDVPPDVRTPPVRSGPVRSGSGSPPPSKTATTTTHDLRSGGGGGGVAPGDEEAGPDGFERWWAMTPKAEPSRRPEALATWNRERLEIEADDIIDYVLGQLATPAWRREGGRYATGPLRLLEGGNWRKLRRGPKRREPEQRHRRSTDADRVPSAAQMRADWAAAVSNAAPKKGGAS